MVTDAKRAKLFHKMLFLLQFTHKYTERKKSVKGTSGPPSQVSVSEIAAPYPLQGRRLLRLMPFQAKLHLFGNVDLEQTNLFDHDLNASQTRKENNPRTDP